ncbi:MAG: alpha/beta hydrolase [Oceanococcaceae bacterium]
MKTLLAATLLLWAATAPAQMGPSSEDVCVVPAPAAEPGTAAWTQRDLQNMACAESRVLEVPLSWALGQVQNPGLNDLPSPARDPYRNPFTHDGRRFRFAPATATNREGEDLLAEVYRPCTAKTCSEVPPGLVVAEGPYPTVLIVHGGASQKELHRWASQGLAEAGYMTIAMDVAGDNHGSDAQDMVEWIFSADFPFPEELDRERVGIVGHSQGASTASLLGQLDPRLKAIVAWDNLTAVNPSLWADDIGVEPPAGLPITTPAIGIGADYYFVPEPYTEPPEPAPSNGEGGRGRGVSAHPKDLGYQELKEAGVDTMLFILRAGTHLDFTPLEAGAGSWFGEPVSLYLTQAWLDRYLKGLTNPAAAHEGHRRLLASVYDDSADVHAIGAGYFDPVEGNQPYRIAGLSACDRMSFYFKSRYALRAPGSSSVLTSEDWKSDCKASATPAPEVASTASSTAGGGLGFWVLLLLGLRQRRFRGIGIAGPRVRPNPPLHQRPRIRCGSGRRP